MISILSYNRTSLYVPRGLFRSLSCSHKRFGAGRDSSLLSVYDCCMLFQTWGSQG